MTAAAAGLDPCAGLLRPQRTLIVSPSTSRPFAHAPAANSAVARSLKLTNAHLSQREHKTTESIAEKTDLDFATYTIDLIWEGSTEGSDFTTRVRTDSSVAEAGRDVRNNDIWRESRKSHSGGPRWWN